MQQRTRHRGLRKHRSTPDRHLPRRDAPPPDYYHDPGASRGTPSQRLQTRSMQDIALQGMLPGGT